MNRKGWKWCRFAQSHLRPTAHFVGETRKCLSSTFDARSIMAWHVFLFALRQFFSERELTLKFITVFVHETCRNKQTETTRLETWWKYCRITYIYLEWLKYKTANAKPLLYTVYRTITENS